MKFAWKQPATVSAPDVVAQSIAQIYELDEPRATKGKLRKYHRGKKPRKQVAPRTYRTRKDPFKNVWHSVQLKLELDPSRQAIDLLKELIHEFPNEFKENQRRTLQRRVSEWRRVHLGMPSVAAITIPPPEHMSDIFTELASLAAHK